MILTDSVLRSVVEDENPYGLVGRLIEALAPGSYVAITNTTQDYMPAEQIAMINAAASSRRHGQIQFRSKAETGRFFDGLDFVPPGIRSVAEWRRDPSAGPPPAPSDVACLGGVARVP